MRVLKQHRPWFIAAAVLAVAVFFIGGAAGGVVAFLAAACFIIGVFVRLRGEHPEDRTVGTGMFGGGSGGGL